MHRSDVKKLVRNTKISISIENVLVTNSTLHTSKPTCENKTSMFYYAFTDETEEIKDERARCKQEPEYQHLVSLC